MERRIHGTLRHQHGRPMVAGAAALLIQKFGPAVTPDTIKAKLMKSTSKSFPSRSTFGNQTIQYDMFTVGAGYLNVLAALNNPNTAPAGKAALSPTATCTCGAAGGSACVKITHAANSFFTNSKTATTWASSVLWGDGKGVFPLVVLGEGDK
jgi:hypothetical protein